ncbi:LPXTG cell wall anchor domain-containing protein [Capnocytophaga gingivalis]
MSSLPCFLKTSLPHTGTTGYYFLMLLGWEYSPSLA